MVVATGIISSYIKKIGMKRSDVDEYITLFPDRVYKYIYEMRQNIDSVNFEELLTYTKMTKDISVEVEKLGLEK